VQVDGDEVHRRADVLGAQLGDEAGAVAGEPLQLERDRVDVPGMLHAGADPGRAYLGDAGEQGVVARHVLLAPALHLVEVLELAEADRGQHVAQVVLEAGRGDLVVPRAGVGVALPGIAVHAVQREQVQPLRQRVVVGDHAATLAGGQVLGGVEREHGRIGEGAHRPAVHCGAQGVRGVLHEADAPRARQRAERREVGGVAAVVHRHDGAGPRRERALDGARVEAERVGLDVHQHRPGTHVLDDVHAGDEGVGRGDDLVARAHAQRGQREVQAAGGGVERQAVAHADPRGDAAAQLLRLRPGGDPAGLQRLDHELLLARADRRPREGQEGGTHRRAAARGQGPGRGAHGRVTGFGSVLGMRTGILGHAAVRFQPAATGAR
jgi:hypothetical protein